MSNEKFFTTGLESRVSRHKKIQKKYRYMLIIFFTLLLAFCMAIIPIIVKNESALSKSGKQITLNHVVSHIDDILQLKKAQAHHEVKTDHAVVDKEELLKESKIQEKKIEVTEEEDIERTTEVVNNSSVEMNIQPKQVIQHKVQPNETLYEITMIYYSNGNAQGKVAHYNGITNPEKEVQAGKVLEIPDPQYMVYHQVMKGDTLQKISQQYYGATKYMNALASHNELSNVNHVPYGISIHIPNPKILQKGLALSGEVEKGESNLQEKAEVSGVYRIEVSKEKNELYVFLGDKLVKTYSVGTGREASMTPVGKFTIVNKLEKPWYSEKGIPGGSPNNPLGSHWLGLSVPGTNGTIYGFHGTNDPSSVGKYVSLGCIRMQNADVQWLYETVPVGTVVRIY